MAGYPSEQPLSLPLGVVHALAKQQQQDSTYFTLPQTFLAARMERRNNPLAFLGDRVEGFLQLKQLGQQIAQQGDPRTRAGLLNDLSMFIGGPKGDATPMMEQLGMPGQFHEYGGAPIDPLSRGLTHEGPNPGARGASMRGLIRRAEGVDPLRRNDVFKVAQAKHDILEKQMAQNIARHRAMQAVKMRRQLDQHLGSAPMAGHVGHPAPEHDYFDAQEFDHLLSHPHQELHSGPSDARVALVHRLLGRRYQAQLGHNHLN